MKETLVKAVNPISLGLVGENDARMLVWDITEWQQLYGSEGTVSIVHVRDDDKIPYLPEITVEGNLVKWPIKTGDLGNGGYGTCQLVYTVGEDVVVKSPIYRTSSAVGIAGVQIDNPSTGETWIKRLIELPQEITEKHETAVREISELRSQSMTDIEAQATQGVRLMEESQTALKNATNAALETMEQTAVQKIEEIDQAVDEAYFLNDELVQNVSKLTTTSIKGRVEPNKYIDFNDRLWVDVADLISIISDPVPCSPGDKFMYKGVGAEYVASYLFYNSKREFISAGMLNSPTEYTEITVPEGCNYVVFTSFAYTPYPDRVIYDVYRVDNYSLEDARKEIKEVAESLSTDLEYDFILQDYPLDKLYLVIDSGFAVSDETSQSTDFIPVTSEDSFKVTAYYRYTTTPICEYDASKKFIRSIFAEVSSSGASVNNYAYKPSEDAVYVRFSSYGNVPLKVYKYVQKTLDDELASLRNNINDLSENLPESLGYTYALQNYPVEPQYLDGTNGRPFSVEGAQATDFIPVTNGDAFKVTAFYQYASAPICEYDASKTFIRSPIEPYASGATITDYDYTPSEDAVYVRFSSNVGGKALKVYKYVQKTLEMELSSLRADNELLKASNILYGKKYVACGDSFTEGTYTRVMDSDGLVGKNSPYLYDSEMEVWKTYPYWIAKRNGMTLVNEAISGSTMALSKEHLDGTQSIDYRDPFSLERYKNIPKDADYLTLMFGLNEGNTPIGTLEDTDNRTIIGAYNVVLEYLITNLPHCRIGIIVSDAWLSEELSNAIKSVSQYWGIPCLDLKYDPKIPLLIGGRDGVSAKAVALRNSQYQLTAEDSHPNVENQKLRSEIIENFLRSL